METKLHGLDAEVLPPVIWLYEDDGQLHLWAEGAPDSYAIGPGTQGLFLADARELWQNEGVAPPHWNVEAYPAYTLWGDPENAERPVACVYWILGPSDGPMVLEVGNPGGMAWRYIGLPNAEA